MGEHRTKIEVTPEVTRQIATRKALGTSLRDLEKEFGISRPVINRILGTDLAKAIVKEVIDSAVVGAVSAIRRELADMTELAMEALRENLKEHNMEAVKTYFKALGIEQQEKDSGNQQQAITVILPGAQAPKDVINEEIN